MRHAFTALFLLLVVSAGCVETGGPGSSTPEAASISTVSEDLSATGVSCHEDLSVNFWGIEEQLWDRNSVRVGYSVPANTSVFLVAYVDGVRSGVVYERNGGDDAIVVDGGEIHLDSSFSGTHTVEIVLYHDEGGNEQFERSVDSPCLDDETVIMAGPRKIDFSEFA
ncbi:hypothetical protein [Halosimplex salinum]|uniref:hypothetical protein n=1 Tax=Halosimplex salinum TaxID=1710538 RepID=UPI000F491D3D|nr:hypothetical protein [Halosimplex salinum]